MQSSAVQKHTCQSLRVLGYVRLCPKGYNYWAFPSKDKGTNNCCASMFSLLMCVKYLQLTFTVSVERVYNMNRVCMTDYASLVPNHT